MAGLGAMLLVPVYLQAAAWQAGSLQVPPPPEGVADWPLIGTSVYEAWSLASQNLEAAIMGKGGSQEEL